MKITIITACYNSASTIRGALESVRRQKVGEGVEIEHLVIDGGSTDGTVEIIKDEECRMRNEGGVSFKWISERDRGLYDALNKGIERSTGEIIGIINADDVIADDEVIGKIAKAFEEGEGLEAVYGDVRFVRGGETLEELRGAATVRYCTGKYFRNWMFRFATFPAHPSTFVRKECFDKYGYYALDYKICADFEMMLRLFYKNRIKARYVPMCTTVMRMGGISTNGVRSNIQINREDLRALRANGVWSCLPLIYLKYLGKIWGFVRRG